VNAQSQRPVFVVLFALLALTILAPVGIWLKSRQLEQTQTRLQAAVREAVSSGGSGRGVDRRLGVAGGGTTVRVGVGEGTGIQGRDLSPLGQRIRELLGEDPAATRPGELVAVFATAAAYQDFLASGVPAGGLVAGRIPELAALRLGPVAGDDAIESLARALEPFTDDLAELAANRKMFLAVPSEYEATSAALAGSSLALLGLPEQALGVDTAGRRGEAWARGIMIALLDTGVDPAVVAERTFRGRDPVLLGALDAGWGLEPAGAHGSGAAAVLSWVAPGARLVGVRVTDDEGVSDLFSVAQGMVNAVNVGADLLALGPVSPEPALILDRAVGLATARGLAVVASTGGAAGTWPAADPRTVTVGSILTRRTELAAVAVAAPQVFLDQTPLDSAVSAAIVAGALADVMSVYPGTRPAEAWSALQYMSAEPAAMRSPLATEFLGSGLQVLNLSWLGSPANFPAGRRGPARGSALASAAGAGRTGRGTVAANPGRALVGPQPVFRRGGATPAAGGRGVGNERTVPLTQSDRTVRGNPVPIGNPGRGGTR
jgi:hypothetical protein